MPEQMEFDLGGMEKKDDVFYARCRPKIKKALYLRMNQDGFTSMTDWFEQFVMKSLGKKKKAKNDSKKRRLRSRN